MSTPHTGSSRCKGPGAEEGGGLETLAETPRAPPEVWVLFQFLREAPGGGTLSSHLRS